MVTDIYYYNFSCKTCKFQTTCRNEKHLKLVNRLHKKKTGHKNFTDKIDYGESIDLGKTKDLKNFEECRKIYKESRKKNWTKEQIDLHKLLLGEHAVV